MVSVIIPIYNTAPYLRQCLTSVQRQTYRDLEILCIDDGSTDGSAEILDEFTKADSRFLTIHQENQGVSHARNRGLERASGEYIAFLDSDDWIETAMYEELLRAEVNTHAEIVAGSWFKENETKAKSMPIRNLYPVESERMGRSEFLRYLFMRDSYPAFGYMWSKLYKRELIEAGKAIRFSEEFSVGEDVLFLSEIALRAEEIVYLDHPFYHYRIREGSSTHTKRLDHMRSWILAYEQVIALFQKAGVAAETVDYVKRFHSYHSSNAAEKALQQGGAESKREFQAFMKKYEKEYRELNLDFPERIKRYEKLLEA